jgi:uncharacterized RDD family membrane protein YckC
MDGRDGEERVVRIASWERRLGAWLIDIILVGVLVDFIVGVTGPLTPVVPWLPPGPAFRWGCSDGALVLFAYWTVLEGTRGRSIGKMALSLRVTDRRGEEIDIPKAAIESFGKAFLLPLDCLIGWIAMPGSGQRLFNRLSDTIVIVDDPSPPEGVRYVKP